MNTNWKMRIQVCDPSGLLLSLSGIVLGVLLAVAEYKVGWGAASVLILTAAIMHIYMHVMKHSPALLKLSLVFFVIYISKTNCLHTILIFYFLPISLSVLQKASVVEAEYLTECLPAFSKARLL